MLFKPFFLCFAFWGQSDWMWHCRVDRSQCVFCAVMSLFCLEVTVVWFCYSWFFFFSFSLQCLIVNTGSPATVCFQKKKKWRNRIVFYWIKRCLLDPSPFRVSPGPFGNTAFLQPRCALLCFGSFFYVCVLLCFHLYGKFCYALLLFIF